MESTFIYIKNMVCDRCIMAVRSLLQEMGLEPLSVRLGEAELSRPLSRRTGIARCGIARLGFDSLTVAANGWPSRSRRLSSSSYTGRTAACGSNLSDYLAERLRHDYDYISGIFSDVEGTTVEKFFIAQKIERVKELLAYDEFR